MAYEFEKIKREAYDFAYEARQKLSAKKVYLYGSYAKGTAKDESDVDICFFFDDIDLNMKARTVSKLISLSTKYNAYFEPNAMPTSELYNGNPFVEEVLRTGIEIV